MENGKEIHIGVDVSKATNIAQYNRGGQKRLAKRKGMSKGKKKRHTPTPPGGGAPK